MTDYNKGNQKAQERMTVNYLFAHQLNVLVVGTDHAAEAVSGFFTRYGDGGVDLTPLTGLNKQQGRSLTCCRQTSNCMMYPYNGNWGQNCAVSAVHFCSCFMEVAHQKKRTAFAHLASPQTVFEIVVDNEIEFLISKPVVLCQYTVYFVNNCFGFPRKYTLYCKHPSILKAHSSHFRMDL